MRERVTMADEKAKLVEERAKNSEETYEKLLRKVKMAENQKSYDLVELKRKNGELESAKKGVEEELELWKREFGKLEERILKLEADTIKIINAENRAILIIDSNDDCAPGATSSTKDDVLKRKRSS